jgi:hypothetical protein
VDKEKSYPHFRRVAVNNPPSYPQHGDNSVDSVWETPEFNRVGTQHSKGVIANKEAIERQQKQRERVQPTCSQDYRFKRLEEMTIHPHAS